MTTEGFVQELVKKPGLVYCIHVDISLYFRFFSIKNQYHPSQLSFPSNFLILLSETTFLPLPGT